MLALNLQLKLITDHFSELVWKVKAQGHGNAWMGVVLGGGRGSEPSLLCPPGSPPQTWADASAVGREELSWGLSAWGALCPWGSAACQAMPQSTVHAVVVEFTSYE